MYQGTKINKYVSEKEPTKPKRVTYKMEHIMRNDRFLLRTSVFPENEIDWKYTDWH